MRALLAFDATLRNWLASHHTPSLDWLMVTLSDVGSRGFIWFVLGAVLVFFRPHHASGVWQMALAIGLSVFLADVIVKPSVGRLRPFEQADDVRVIAPRPATFSFPSGHAGTAFAGATALARIWPGARVGLWTLAMLIALSRVYVGVHYPIDIVAGAILGILAALFAIGTVWPEVEASRGKRPPWF